MIDAGAGFEVLVEAAAKQICAQSRVGDVCLLAGYSFGGLMAAETARRLEERGRRIGFLGLIDTEPPEIAQARRESSATDLTSVFRPMKFIGQAISALILMSAFRSLKIIGQLAELLPAKAAFTIEFMLNTRLRHGTLRRLHLKPIQLPITLYLSGEGASKLLEDGWNAHCGRIAVVRIGGTHQSILEPPFLDVLCRRFFEDASMGIATASGFSGP